MIIALFIIFILLSLILFYKRILHLSMTLLIIWNSILVFFLIGTNEFKIYFPETVLVILAILGFILFQNLLIASDKNETEIDQG